MATKLEICNMAIELIGKRTVASLTQSTREAQVANRFYDQARKAVLRDHLWSFATKSKALAAVSVDSDIGFDFTYQYPTDALYAHKIYNGTGEGEIEYQIQANESLTQKYLLTNKDDAILIYVADVDEENMFDNLFTEALSYKLASMMIIPLKGESQLAQQITQMYGMTLDKAKATDSNESYKTPKYTNTLMDARL